MSRALSAWILGLAVLLLPRPSPAQSLNLDFGTAAGPAPASYGAAAGLVGQWNIIPEANNLTNPHYSLVDLNAAPTGAVLRVSGGNAFHWNDPATVGADAALLDDQLEPTSTLSARFEGLLDGPYEIWVYAWGSDDPTAWTSRVIAPRGAPTSIVGGVAWSGVHAEGGTYARSCADVVGGVLEILVDTLYSGGGFASCNGMQLVRLAAPCASTGAAFCSGNGSGTPGCATCPCGNPSFAGFFGGCAHSHFQLGAELFASRSPGVVGDTLRLRVMDALPNSFAILVSADNRLPGSGTCPTGSGVMSGQLDGLRCVGGALLRHGARTSDGNGYVGFGSPGWGPPDGPPGGLAASGGFVSGQVRHFQVTYREHPSLGCGRGLNTSSAVSVTF